MQTLIPTDSIANFNELLHHLTNLRENQKKYFKTRNALYLNNSKLLESQLDNFLSVNSIHNTIPLSQQKEMLRQSGYHGSMKNETQLEFWDEHTNG
jgi:hypothetical protein